MSASELAPKPPTSAAPLSVGPIPLSTPAAWIWALVVLGGTLFLGLGLPIIAARVADVTVPPGSITFGSASIVPAEGWALTDQTATSVTLDDKGVWVVFRSLSAQGASAAVRAEDLAEDMMQVYPALTSTSDAYPFTTPTGDQGLLIAVASSRQTSVVASVVRGSQAVDVQSLGESTLFGESIADIENMIESIRIQDVP